jgi:hypothetical protein
LNSGEVAVGDLVFEQVARLLEQVDVGLIGGELDLVAHARELPRRWHFARWVSLFRKWIRRRFGLHVVAWRGRDRMAQSVSRDVEHGGDGRICFFGHEFACRNSF